MVIHHRRNTTSKPPDHTRQAHRTSETDRYRGKKKRKNTSTPVAGDAAARQAGRPRRTPASGQRSPRRAPAFPILPPCRRPHILPAADSLPRLSSRAPARSLPHPRGGGCCRREHGHRRRHAAAAGRRAARPPWTGLPPPAPRRLAYVSTSFGCCCVSVNSVLHIRFAVVGETLVVVLDARNNCNGGKGENPVWRRKR